MVYLVFLHNSSFSWGSVSAGRTFRSAESSKCMKIRVLVQLGAGASSVVSTCFSSQVIMIGRNGPPASATEITQTWSYCSTPSNWLVCGAYHAALICSSCPLFSGAIHSDAECSERPQLMQKALVACTGSDIGENLVIYSKRQCRASPSSGWVRVTGVYLLLHRLSSAIS